MSDERKCIKEDCDNKVEDDGLYCPACNSAAKRLRNDDDDDDFKAIFLSTGNN